MITSALSSLLEKQMLSEELHDLLIHLTNLNTESFSKKQYGHLWWLVYQFNLEDAMKGNNDKKILKKLKDSYNLYSSPIAKKKYKFTPEVQTAYELAIKVFSNDSDVVTKD